MKCPRCRSGDVEAKAADTTDDVLFCRSNRTVDGQPCGLIYRRLDCGGAVVIEPADVERLLTQ